MELVDFIEKNSSLRARIIKDRLFSEQRVEICLDGRNILISGLIWKDEKTICYMMELLRGKDTITSSSFGRILLIETEDCSIIEFLEPSDFQELMTSGIVKRFSITKKEIAESWLIDE